MPGLPADPERALAGRRPVRAEAHVHPQSGLTVDQCLLTSNRYTLIAPDAYRGDYLEIALWGISGKELARESLYEDDGDGDGDGE